MHSNPTCSCCSAPWLPYRRPAWSPDQSQDIRAPVPFPIPPWQTRWYRQTRFRCAQPRCWWPPCRCLRRPPADTWECRLSGFRMHQEALPLLLSGHLRPLPPPEPWAGYHATSMGNSLLPPVGQTAPRASGQNPWHGCPPGTCLPHHQCPEHVCLSASSAHIPPA